MKIRASFVNINNEVNSINELTVETIAKAQQWIEKETQIRSFLKKVDIVDITDSNDTFLGTYYVSINKWDWLI